MAGKRRTIIAITTRIIVCVVIITLSSVIYIVLRDTKPLPERRGENRDLHPVFVMRAALTEVRRQYEGYGTAQAMDSADVPARVTSTVIDLPEDMLPGNKVMKGQVLAWAIPSVMRTSFSSTVWKIFPRIRILRCTSRASLMESCPSRG